MLLEEQENVEQLKNTYHQLSVLYEKKGNGEKRKEYFDKYDYVRLGRMMLGPGFIKKRLPR